MNRILILSIFFAINAKCSYSFESDSSILYRCKIMSHVQSGSWISVGQLDSLAKVTQAVFLESNGWRKGLYPVRFVCVTHVDRYKAINQLYSEVHGAYFGSDANGKFKIFVDSLIRIFGDSMYKTDEGFIAIATSIDPKFSLKNDKYIYLIEGNNVPIFISKNGIRMSLSYYDEYIINKYYNGLLFDSNLKDEKGNAVVQSMHSANILKGYPYIFPVKYKKYFTVNGIPTQLFMPDTCFGGLKWIETFKYKPDY